MRRRRNGREYRQRFERGQPTSELESSRVPRGAPPRTGTRVRFLYDAAVFATRCVHNPLALLELSASPSPLSLWCDKSLIPSPTH